MTKGWESKTQKKNIAWYLPRPKPDRYPGGMPLHCEKWLIEFAKELGDFSNPKVLQPFGGKGKIGMIMDIKKDVNPHVVGDAHDMKFEDESFDIVLCDPPYSNEEAKELYGTPKLNYKKWSNEAVRVLKKGGILILYHKKVLPNPNPDKVEIIKRVFIGNRIWHAPRVALFFKKKSTSIGD